MADAEKPTLIITFDGQSAAFSVEMAGGVNPTQVYIACHFMALQAEAQIMQRMAQAQAHGMPNIIPITNGPGGPGDAADLIRRMRQRET